MNGSFHASRVKFSLSLVCSFVDKAEAKYAENGKRRFFLPLWWKNKRNLDVFRVFPETNLRTLANSFLFLASLTDTRKPRSFLVFSFFFQSDAIFVQANVFRIDEMDSAPIRIKIRDYRITKKGRKKCKSLRRERTLLARIFPFF